METTIVGYIGIIIRYILGLYRDNGKGNGSFLLVGGAIRASRFLLLKV